jgi:hypothetical protein
MPDGTDGEAPEAASVKAENKPADSTPPTTTLSHPELAPVELLRRSTHLPIAELEFVGNA